MKPKSRIRHIVEVVDDDEEEERERRGKKKRGSEGEVKIEKIEERVRLSG